MCSQDNRLKSAVRNMLIESNIKQRVAARMLTPEANEKTFARLLALDTKLLPSHRTALLGLLARLLRIDVQEVQAGIADPHSASPAIQFALAGRRFQLSDPDLTRLSVVAEGMRSTARAVTLLAANLGSLFTMLDLVCGNLIDGVVQPPHPRLELWMPERGLRSIRLDRYGGDEEHPAETMMGMVAAATVSLQVLSDDQMATSSLSTFTSVALIDGSSVIAQRSSAYATWQARDGCIEQRACAMLAEAFCGMHATHARGMNGVLELLRKVLPAGSWSRWLTAPRIRLARTFS